MATSFVVFVDPAFDFQTRQQIGRDIIVYIKDRTAQGLGIGRQVLGKYSQNYKDTREFQIAKSGESKVNLTLTGDMLNSIEILDASIAGRIEIGIDGGFEADKAEWVQEKGYNFLGVTEAELSDIVSEYQATDEDAQLARNEIGESFAREFLRGIFGSR
jgi:hypothetical protein